MSSTALAIRKMWSKITLRLHLTPVEWLRWRKQLTRKASEGTGKENPHSLWAELQTCAATTESSVEILKKLKSQLELFFSYAQRDEPTHSLTYRSQLQAPDVSIPSRVIVETREVKGEGEGALWVGSGTQVLWGTTGLGGTQEGGTEEGGTWH